MAGPFFVPRRAWLLVLGGLWGCVGLSERAMGQMNQRSYPSQGYYVAFNDFYDGDYDNALKRFVIEGKGGIKSGALQSRWIDSICYETMIGECYYEMGHLNEALECYTNAVQLAVAFPDWMMRVSFPAIRPAGASVRRGVPWGASTRGAKPGLFPQTMLISQGQVDITQQLQQGGVVTMPSLLPIDVQEIVRCTTLAIRRRTKLLGPLASRDPLFQELRTKLQGRVGPPNHWSEAWVGVELGTALAATGREGQAVMLLQRSVVAGGEFDHPLTGVALFELGRLAMIRRRVQARAELFPRGLVLRRVLSDVASRRQPLGRMLPLRPDGAPDGQSRGNVSAPGHGRPLVGGQSFPAVAGLAAVVRRGELRRAGRAEPGGPPAGQSPRQHRPAHHGGRQDRRTAELPHRDGPVPAEEGRRRRCGDQGGHELHAARLALALPNLAGRQHGHQQSHDA